LPRNAKLNRWLRPDRPEGLTKGYYVNPPSSAHVTKDMPSLREEVFGRSLGDYRVYENDDEAVPSAKHTNYGLSGMSPPATWIGSQRGAGVSVPAWCTSTARRWTTRRRSCYKESGNGREWRPLWLRRTSRNQVDLSAIRGLRAAANVQAQAASGKLKRQATRNAETPLLPGFLLLI